MNLNNYNENFKHFAAVYLMLQTYTHHIPKKFPRNSISYSKWTNNWLVPLKEMVKKGRIGWTGRKIKSGSSRKRGNIWVPINPSLVDKDPFGNKFKKSLKMSKSDILFREVECRIIKSSLEDCNVHGNMSFLCSSRYMNEDQRSRRSDFATLTTTHSSRFSRTF